MSNVAEGSTRKNRELLHFFFISLGSLREVECQILISRDLGYITEFEYEETQKLLNIIIKDQYNYMKRISSNSKTK